MNSVRVKSTENIFEAIGFEKEEADSLLIRSQLLGEIKQYIKDSGMSLRSAAAFFGVSHPRISDIMQGRIDKFKIDYLVDMTAKTGKKVTITVTDRKAA